MQAEQFQAILDAYGGRPECWPGEQRVAMEAYLAQSESARRALAEALALDGALDSFVVESVDLTDRIINAIPPSRFDALMAWLFPETPLQWWRPATAAALPLVLGIAIGLADGVAPADWSGQEQSLLVPFSEGLFDTDAVGGFE